MQRIQKIQSKLLRHSGKQSDRLYGCQRLRYKDGTVVGKGIANNFKKGGLMRTRRSDSSTARLKRIGAFVLTFLAGVVTTIAWVMV